jgi:hypothetical protein
MCAQVPNGERVAAARELMQIAGVAKQFDELMPYLTRQLTQSFTAIAPDKATEIGEVLGQLTTGGLLGLRWIARPCAFGHPVGSRGLAR